MAQVETRLLQNSFIRWGVSLIGMLVVAGAVSIATREMYTKKEVDERLATAAEINRLERMVISAKLDAIAANVNDIKRTLEKDGVN